MKVLTILISSILFSVAVASSDKIVKRSGTGAEGPYISYEIGDYSCLRYLNTNKKYCTTGVFGQFDGIKTVTGNACKLLCANLIKEYKMQRQIAQQGNK